MSKTEKPFDALAAKDSAQRRILKRIAGLPPEQEIAVIRKEVEDGPLGTWWRSLPKDPGPQPEATPAGGRSREGS